jgi:F0F1-type ATP synthase assembly protein I
MGYVTTKATTYFSDRDKLQATAAAQVAVEAKTAAEKAAQASAVTQAQYQQMVDMLSRQNAQLAQAITSRDSILGQKVTEVSQPKTPTGVVNDLNEAYKGTTPSTITPDGQVSFDPTVVQKFTVAKIERDTFQSDLADETKVAANTQVELDKSNQLSGTLGTEVTALNNQIVADKNSCDATVKSVKATARAGKIKAFKWGLVIGFVSGIFVGHGVI